MGLVWWGCGVPKLVLARAETHGENPVMKLLMIWQFAFTFFEMGGGKLDCSILIPGYILMGVVIHHLCAVAFSSTHTPSWQVLADGWWLSPVVCAGSVLGMQIPGQVFLLTRQPWAYQVISLWIVCLFKQVCVEGGGKCEEKEALLFCSCWVMGIIQYSGSAKRLSFKASSIFWMKKKF